MKLIKCIYEFIFEKYFFLLLSIVIFFILKVPIETFISNTVVEPVSSHIEPTCYNDACFFLIIGCAVIFVWYRLANRYIPSPTFTQIIISITVIYLFYRYKEVTWKFTPLALLPYIKYADILIVIYLAQLLLWMPHVKVWIQDKLRKNRKVNEKLPLWIQNAWVWAQNKYGQDEKPIKNSLFDDHPLNKEDLDEKGKDPLGYSTYAQNLGEKILNSQFDNAFAIGINGKWGIGKTSFINLLKSKVKGEDIIEINFNPWNSHSPQAIIQDFFETVHEAIRPYHSSLSRKLIQYSNKLIKLNSNKVTQSIQTTVSAITGFDSVNKLHSEIDAALKKIDRKMVIYIDDVDRLDSQEIVEVIRLIRNTANFYNTFFIVAYDRNYVVSALQQHNAYKQENFLEKIFQIEVTLPYFKKNILQNKLAEKLNQEPYRGLFVSFLKVKHEVDFLNKWLESMRDVTRLANALILNFNMLEGEVDFYDFMRIELLRLKYPSVYELLFRETSEFLVGSSNSPDKKLHYRLNKPEGKEPYLKHHLEDNYTKLSIPKSDISKIVNFVDSTFSSNHTFHTRSHLSIVYPSRFALYFAYNLLEGALSEVALSKARAQSQEEFNSRISQWIDEGLDFELKNRFEEIKDFDNRDDFEKVIKAILHLANQAGYDENDLFNKLSNYDNKLTKKYYPGSNGQKELTSFIKSLLREAKSPYLFEASFLRYVNKYHSDSFPLSIEECKEFTIEYLKKYSKETKSLNRNIWSLFNCCKQTVRTPTGSGNAYSVTYEPPEEAKTILKEFVLDNDIDGFIFEMVKDKWPGEKLYMIDSFADKLFNGWDKFKEAIDQQEDDKGEYLKEFKEFLALFAAEGYSKYIAFEFKEIPK